MNKRELARHKSSPKTLTAAPEFKNIKRKKLPKPFQNLGGERIYGTPLIEVSEEHVLFCFYRDGPTLQDSAFYGHLMHRVKTGFYPVLHFHWHPSHKGFHCKVPCGTDIDYTNRMLPGAPELSLATSAALDPRDASDRLKLIHQVCQVCNIQLGSSDESIQPSLWAAT